RPLTVEETIEVMRTDPKKASLQEMFLVAQTYDPGSEEFNEAMAIAVATYPDDPVANLNAGAVALNSGDLDAAAAYLAKAGDAPEAFQARGVLAMQRGDFAEAERLLTQALELGVEDAEYNLAVLRRMRALASQNR
ncbi:MAG: tetratricopeptide repeat protein, partial [Muribaculaceae bacterium]|nr:tetratricopeptide repeat protein [Muribaculaceae bacterium]